MYKITVLSLCSVILWVGYSPISVNAQTSSEAESTTLQLLEEQEHQIRLVVLLALIPVVVAFSFVTFVFYRRKREAFFRQTEAELKLSKAEVEIKALKAQINPHFIFNCMNSIHHYMHKNDIKKAGDYLIKFSQLIRMVLENSSHDTTTLKEDLHALHLYIQLEQLRLENRFEYQIEIDSDIDQQNVEIPSLLIQPFVENAIWHELTKIAEEGLLFIVVSLHEEGILCTITSSGKGQVQPALSTALTDGISKTSMGLSLIRERLSLINRMNGTKAYFHSRDTSDPSQERYGYEVKVYLPVKDLEE